MAFKVRKLPYRPWPVMPTLRECREDGSIVETTHSFVAHFRPFTEQEFGALRTEVFGAGSDEEITARSRTRTISEQAELEIQFFSGLIVGWAGVTGEDGQPIPFCVVSLCELLRGADGPEIRRALGNSLLELRLGLAPLKTASSSPAPGPAMPDPAAETTSSSAT